MRRACFSILTVAVLLGSCRSVAREGVLPVAPGALARLDQTLATDWTLRGLTPAPLTDDATFLRRLTFDLYGRPPRVDELRLFELDADPAKRPKRVAAMLGNREFADAWAWLFVDTLNGFATTRQGVNEEVFQTWRSEAITRAMPYDEVVKALLTANGSTDLDGPSNFFTMNASDPMQLTATTGKAFLGLEIGCAQCHDHPSEKWSQRDFYGLAAHFARVKQKREKGPPPTFHITDLNKGELKLGDGPSAEVIAPRVLAFGAAGDSSLPRREALAAWVASPRNPLFARAWVTRVWRHFNETAGGGVALPEDGRKHLEELFVASKFDERAVLALILDSRAYQLSSSAVGPTVVRAPIRALTGRQLVTALSSLAEAEQGEAVVELDKRKKRLGAVKQFKKAFSDDAALADPEGFKPSVPQTLLLRNGGMTNQVLRPNSELMSALKDLRSGGGSPEAVLDELCLAVVGRHPLPEEQEAFQAELTGRKEKNPMPVLQDVAWALINSSDFLFNR